VLVHDSPGGWLSGQVARTTEEKARSQFVSQGISTARGRRSRLSAWWRHRRPVAARDALRRCTVEPAEPTSVRIGLALPVIERAAIGTKHSNAAGARRACRIGNTLPGLPPQPSWRIRRREAMARRLSDMLASLSMLSLPQ
jgi:hypothetical protein